jgi:hypothetical protein
MICLILNHHRYVSMNVLTSIEDGAFNCLSKLATLYKHHASSGGRIVLVTRRHLYQNGITSISSLAFASLSSLQQL